MRTNLSTEVACLHTYVRQLKAKLAASEARVDALVIKRVKYATALLWMRDQDPALVDAAEERFALTVLFDAIPSKLSCNYPDCNGEPATGYCHNDCRTTLVDQED